MLNGSAPPVEQPYCSNDSFCIPVMLLCKQRANGGLTLCAPLRGPADENACNHWSQGAGALGFTLDQRSKMGNGNLYTREAAECMGLTAVTQLPHSGAAFATFMLRSTLIESWYLLWVPDTSDDLCKWLFSFKHKAKQQFPQQKMNSRVCFFFFFSGFRVLLSSCLTIPVKSKSTTKRQWGQKFWRKGEVGPLRIPEGTSNFQL